MFKVGMRYEEAVSFSQQKVDAFANLVGDHNYLHKSNQENYGVFSGPIVHGALVMGQFSKIFATDLPGPGTIYLSQDTKFSAPLYVGQEASFVVEIIDIADKYITLGTKCIADGKELCTGTARLRNKSLWKEDIIDGLTKLGLKAGDVVLTHSSYKSFGPIIGGPNTVIEAILDVITDDGTLVVPTFNFDFARGIPYNHLTTKSNMGILTEMVRTRPDATRIYHPMYSFAILGKLSWELSRIDNTSAYAEDSMFGELRRRNGKILILGLSYNNSMTFFHHVEEMVGCDYRYMKNFVGDIIYKDGTSESKTYSMYVRNIDAGVKTMVDPMGKRLEELGAVHSGQIGYCQAKLLDANQVFELTKDIPRHEPNLLREIRK